MKTVIDVCGKNALENCLGNPAALVTLTGRELLGYALDRLRRAGCESAIICCTRYVSEFSDYCEECGSFPVKVCEPENIAADDDILILGGDYYFTSALSEMTGQEAPAVLVCPEGVGSELISLSAAQDGSITGIDSRSEGVCFAGALYLPEAFAGYYRGGLEKTLSALFEDGAVLSPVTAHFSARVTDTAALLELQRHLLDNAGALSLPEPGGRIYSEQRSLSGVKLIPPVYIGRNVSLSPGAEIGPYTVIGDGVTVGRRAVLSGAYIGEKCVIGAHSVINDAALFDNAAVGNAVRVNEGAAVGRGAAVYDGAVICAGVSIYAGRKVFEGAYVCDDLTRGSISRRFIGDDGCCTMGARSSPAEHLRFGAALASALPLNSTVAVAHSGSPAAEDMCSCLRMGLTSGGCRVLELGEGTRQLLSFTLSRCRLTLGCFVTGGSEDSIILMSQGGLPLTLDTERSAERAYSGGGTRSVPMPERSTSAGIPGLRLLYEDWLRSVLPERPNISVSVKCPNRQIQLLSDSIFSGLDEGSGEQLIFHISHDGSACSAFSRSSGYVLHDRLLLIAVKYAFRSGVPVAVPYDFTAAADLIAEEENGRLYRYLTASDGCEDKDARSCAARIDNLFVRDGLALAAYITMLAEKAGKPFAELAAEIPAFYCTRRYIGLTEPAKDLAAELSANAVGRGAEYIGQGGRAVIRPVKGSRGLMIFAESFSAEAAMSLCEEVTAKVRKLSGFSADGDS